MKRRLASNKLITNKSAYSESKNGVGNIEHWEVNKKAEEDKIKYNSRYGVDWRIFVIITLLVCSPKILQEAWSYYHLRSGWVRPSVAIGDERQILILGVVGSGKVQMAAELGKLGLEVGHESFDAYSSQVRDGTISFVHGLRYMSQRPLRENIADLCKESRTPAFHPTMFKPNLHCSSYSSWDRCWMLQCASTVILEYGCAAHPGGLGITGAPCHTPFRRTLLQVRHPLRSIASMLGGLGSKNSTSCSRAKHLFHTAQTLFPDQPWEAVDKCIHKFALLWLVYNRAIMQYADDFYRVEDTPPCKVASLAGFTNSTDVIFPAHLDRVNSVCSKRDYGEGPGNREEHGTVNRKNSKGIEVTWKMLEGAPYPVKNLRNQVQDLARRLGYIVRGLRKDDEEEEESVSYEYITPPLLVGAKMMSDPVI